MAMGVGVIVHIPGDMLTTGGCNLAWTITIKPAEGRRRHPGSWQRLLLLVPIGLYAIAVSAPWPAWAKPESPPWHWPWDCPQSSDIGPIAARERGGRRFDPLFRALALGGAALVTGA